MLARHGQVVLIETYGQRDIEAGAPVELDTIFRVYSMTKPITSVAALMLWEEGAFELKDPVRRFIPSFADARVWRAARSLSPVTDPITEPMRIWHLLTHTAGLTYGFVAHHPVDELYRHGRLRVGRARRRRPGGRAATTWPRCRCCSSPAPSGTTAMPPTCSAGSSRSRRACRSTSSSPSASSTRSA